MGHGKLSKIYEGVHGAIRAGVDRGGVEEEEVNWRVGQSTMTKRTTTFDRIMKDPKRRRKFDSKYRSFVRNEVIVGLVEGRSVQELAREFGISPSVIEDIRSGEREGER